MTTSRVQTQTEMESVNPANEQVMGRFPLSTGAEVDSALEDARIAFPAWRRTSFQERGELMRRAAAYLRSNKARLAGLITAEMGKPIVEAEAEIEKCAIGCEHYAGNAEKYLADSPRPSSATESYVSFEPVGTILGIMPWNFPFWQAFRFAAPTLMAGNTILMKHASNVPRCTLAIDEVFRQSDFPAGVFKALLLSGTMAEQLVADPRVAAVTLTGSEGAGRKVAAAAGTALKKSVLELGGSDPFIVLGDADVDTAAKVAIRARNQNAGQSCIASKRFIVVESVAHQFLERFVAGVAELKVGDPIDRSVQVGPLARRDLVEALDRQVKASIVDGAEVLLGGTQPRPGFYYTPTVLGQVTPDMAVFREETFGPVAAVVTVPDDEGAISMANETTFGLGASLWTRDTEKAKSLASKIESGMVFVNGMVASEPAIPFGGIKNSGYGRELSEFGIREFVNVKTVWIGPARDARPNDPAE